MFRKNFVCFLFIFIGFNFSAIAQLTVSFPQQRAIFQRDNSNNGKIHIYGNVPPATSRVEARLLPVTSGQGTQTDWVSVDTDPRGGSFSGEISGRGGWYVLQLRSFENTIQNGSAQVDRVGIGEVFIVAGQSNAQGFDFPLSNQKNATDDRVNAYTHYRNDFLNENPPIGEFAQLKNSVNIGPRGRSAWAWGELGDLLVRDLNVPVMFFNTGYESTNVENWRKSAQGELTLRPYVNTILPNQTPYSNLRIVLQNHTSVYGLRSILWIQGETDNFFRTAEEKYFQDLKLVIEKTRSDTGKRINWMVTRTSLDNNEVFIPVINAQNRIINSLDAVFAGPETDKIQFPRPDGVHFFNKNFDVQGLSELASAFKVSLGSSFFQNSVPTLPNPVLKPEISCKANNLAELSIPGTFSSFVWNGNNIDRVISQNSGTFQAVASDSFGNYLFSPRVDLRRAYPGNNPIISPLGKVEACKGEELKYTADRSDVQVVWQNGSVSQTYTSTVNENIFAIFQNTNGCKSNSSNTLRSSFVDQPNKPVIFSTSGFGAACEGTNVELRVEDTSENKIINWSNGQTGPGISISGVGKTSLFATASTPLGCLSESSDPFEVEIVNRPIAPLITKTGPYSIGIERLENHTAYQWYEENTLVEITKGNQFQVPKDGFYRVLSMSDFPELGITCPSSFSGLFNFFRDPGVSGVRVYPIPVKGDEFFIASDRQINRVNLTLVDAIGRVQMEKAIINLNLPQSISVKNNQLQGKYFLKVDFEGFYRVFPMVFE